MATAFAGDDYDDYTGRIGPDGEPERYSTMLGGDPRLAQQRELASRADRLAQPILIDNWLNSITKDARGTEAASQVTLTPGVEYRIRDFTGSNDGQIIASGSTPEELLRLQDAAQALARQGTRADYRLEQVGGPAVAGFQTYTDPATGQTVQVIGGDLYNKPIASTIAEIAIPVALAVLGGIYLAPLIAPGAAAGSAAAAGGLAAGAGIGSTVGNVLVGRPIDQALISGLTTAATAGGGSFLGPVVGPIVGSGPVGTGIGAATGNFLANIATGQSLENAARSAGISGLTAGAIDALFPGGFNNNADSSTGLSGTKFVDGKIVDNISGEVLSAAEIASARASQAALGSSSGGTGSTGGGGATVATGGGPLITVTNSGIGSGLTGATIAGGAANLNLPNIGNVDISNVRVPSNDEVSGTYRDLEGNIRDNTTGTIIVSNTTGGIGTLGSTLGAGATATTGTTTNTGDGREQVVEGDRDRVTTTTGAATTGTTTDTKVNDVGQITVTGDKNPPPGPRRATAVFLPNSGPETEVTGQRIRTKIPYDPVRGTVDYTDLLNLGLPEPVQTVTGRKNELNFPTNPELLKIIKRLDAEPEGPSTKQKVLSGLRLLFGLAPIVGLLGGGGDDGGGVLDPGPGLPPGGTGGIGRLRNPATFDPFTYGQRSGEFEFFRNAPTTTGTVTGIGGTGTTTGTTGTTTTGTTTRTTGPPATAAEVSAAYPGFTNIRQSADGRWFGEPIPGYTAPATPATGLRVTAGATFNPTVDDYKFFNPGFDSIERNADGRYSGVREVVVAGTPGMTLAQVQARFGSTHRDITQDASGRFIGTRDVPGQVTGVPTTLEQVRALNLGYDDYGQNEDKSFYGITNVTTSTPRPFTLEDARARFGSTYRDIRQNPDGQFFGTRTEQVSQSPTLEQIRMQGSGRNQGLGYQDYEQDGTDFYGISTGPNTVVPGTRLTFDQIRAANPGFDDYGTNEAGDVFGVRFEDGGPRLAEGGEVDDDMVRHLVEYRKGGGHLGPGRVKGIGSGQDDKIPAWLSDGEYVWSAQDVADLGDGSTDEGVRRLDKMRQMVRKGAGRKDVKKIAKPQRGIENMLKAVGGAV